jgi:hypothetical protein
MVLASQITKRLVISDAVGWPAANVERDLAVGRAHIRHANMLIGAAKARRSFEARYSAGG